MKESAQASMDGCDDDFTGTSVYQVNTMEHGSNSARDCDHAYSMVQGDLA